MSIPIKLNPLGINKKNDYRTPLTLTALENNSSVQLVCVTQEGYSGSSSVDFSKMYYRTNESNTWIKYNNEVINLYNEGDYVQFVNSNNILSISNLCFANFVMTGKIAGSGNVQSLLNFQKYVYNYSFYGLFSNCTSLIYPPSFLGKFPNGHSNQYFDTFYGCINLLEAPDLMEEEIHGQSYLRMFYNCKSLQYPPKMPKTITLTNSSRHCYLMFYGCSSLKETPEFEYNGTAYISCFQSMFEGCTSLEICKIKLSSTTLGPSCYRGMFYNCKLDEIPELPATTLSNECYMRMFCGCGIEEATLPATVLADYCYYEMFYNCRCLNRVHVSFTEWENFSHSTTNWLVGTRPNGRFYKPDTLTEEYGNDRIPESWWLSEPPSQPLNALTVNALKDSTVKIIVYNGTPTTSGLCYRRDVSNSWSTYTIDDELSIEKGKYIQFMNTEDTLNRSGNTVRFVITGVVSISGDIMSMLNYASQCKQYCFNYLFHGNNSIYSCKNLILSGQAAVNNCYASLFSLCLYMYECMDRLPSAPQNVTCYSYIFNNCQCLKEMPNLPENFAAFSYVGAFAGCGTSLTNGIKTAPLYGEIKGKSACYRQMFQSTKINRIEVDFTEWDSNSNADYNSTGNWFLYVNERNYNGTFIKPPELNTEYGDSRIPTGWRIIESSPLTLTAEQSNSTVKLVSTGNPAVKKLQYRTNSNLMWKKYNINTVITLENVGDYVQFWNECEQLSLSVTDYVHFSMTGKISGSGNIQSLLDFSNNTSNYCFFGLFWGCSSLISAPDLPSTIMSYRCYEEMFSKCTSLVSAPELPSTILAANCYQDMFIGCTSLINVPELPAVTLLMSCYLGMFRNCTSLVNPPKLPSTSPAYACYYEIFNNNESIQKIDVDFEYWLDNLSTNNWVKDVYQDGVFLKPENLPEEYGYSRIPVNFKPFDKNKPLTLTAVEDNSTVKIIKYGNPSSLHVYYKKNNGEWTKYEIDTVIDLNKDDFVQFKNTTTERLSTGNTDFYNFVMTGTIKASGNVQSLLNFSDTAEWYSFRKLFQNCKSLIEAPTVLPAKHVKGWAYASMFGKTSITNMPIILAEDFGTDACYYMFEECPITYVKLLDKKGKNGTGCFERMFNNCQNLKVIDVDFTEWDTVNGNNEHKYWCPGTPNNITFLKKRELNKMFSDNGIHSGWNVYNPLKFIQASGTQYVNTNITPSGNFEVEVYCTGNLSFGSCGEDDRFDKFYFSINTNEIDFCFSDDYETISKTGIGNRKNIIKYGTDGKFYIDGELVYCSESAMLVREYHPLYVFAINSNGTAILRNETAKIFRIKMWRDGILVSDIIPVDADGGHLFDRLNNICFSNSGTGDFVI